VSESEQRFDILAIKIQDVPANFASIFDRLQEIDFKAARLDHQKLDISSY